MEWSRSTMHRGLFVLIPILLVLFLTFSCSRPEEPSPPGDAGAQQAPGEAVRTAGEGAGPKPAAVEIDGRGRIHPTAPDRCPVCAMKVVNHPEFACGIQMKDGRTFYFCGTGCMIRSWLHPEIFLGAEKDALRRAVVQDYFDGKSMDSHRVIWIAGSDVVGPMGPALVPVRDQEALEAFQGRHGGKTVCGLSEMNDDMWKSITGKDVTP